MKTGMMPVLVSLLFALPVSAQETPKPEEKPKVEVHGFSLGTFDTSTSQIGDHTRLIVTGTLSDKLAAKLSYCIHGPQRTFVYQELMWKNPTKGIDQITVGRTFPPFGRVWYDYRVDQVPSIYYSDIFAPIAAGDSGVTVTGHAGKLKWYLGGYGGDAEFGNDFGPSGLVRAEYQLSPSLTLATSQRISQTPAHGFDLLYQKGRLRAIGELVSSDGLTQYLVLSDYRVTKRASVSLQHEWLATGNRWTLAARHQLGTYGDIKLGYQLGEHYGGRFIAQAAVRW